MLVCYSHECIFHLVWKMCLGQGDLKFRLYGTCRINSVGGSREDLFQKWQSSSKAVKLSVCEGQCDCRPRDTPGAARLSRQRTRTGLSLHSEYTSRCAAQELTRGELLPHGEPRQQAVSTSSSGCPEPRKEGWSFTYRQSQLPRDIIQNTYTR